MIEQFEQAVARACAFVLMTAVLFGCGGAPAANPGSGAGGAESARQPTKLTYMFPDDPPSVAAANALIKAYTSQNPAIQVTPQPLPAKDYAQQLLTRLGSDAPDLFVSADTQATALINRNALLDLQPLLAQAPKLKPGDFQPTTLAPWRRDAALYGLPADVVPQVLFYNQELFDANGLAYPTDRWTWGDWLAAAQKLTVRSGDQVTRYGTTLMPWSAMVWGNGGELMNAAGTQTMLDRPEAIAGVQFAADMVNVHKVAPPPPDAEGPDPIKLFKEQGVAMLPAPSNQAGGLLEAKLPFKWGIAPLPAGPMPVSPLSISGLGVSARSPNKQAALDFAAWVVGSDGNAIKASILPFAAPALRSASARSTQVSGADAIIQALQRGRTLPQVEQWPQIKALVDSALKPVWQGKQSVAAAYRAAAPNINALLLAA